MKNRRHKGYGKPVLRLRRGVLEVTNVPAPPAGLEGPGAVDRVGAFARALRTVQIGQRLLSRARPWIEDGTREVALEVLSTLDALNRDKGSVLVVVYLPVQWELSGTDSRSRLWLAEAAPAAGLTLVDLTPDMRRLDAGAADALFIPEGARDDPDAGGHHSERGHAWVAETLYRRLTELPAARTALDPSR